jgi:hypothetical protein
MKIISCKKEHKEKYHLSTLQKRLAAFPSPAGMPLTKLKLAGNNLIILRQREFG